MVASCLMVSGPTKLKPLFVDHLKSQLGRGGLNERQRYLSRLFSLDGLLYAKGISEKRKRKLRNAFVLGKSREFQQPIVFYMSQHSHFFLLCF